MRCISKLTFGDPEMAREHDSGIKVVQLYFMEGSNSILYKCWCDLLQTLASENARLTVYCLAN